MNAFHQCKSEGSGQHTMASAILHLHPPNCLGSKYNSFFFFFYIPHPIYHRVYLIRPSIYRLNFFTSYHFHCKNPYPKHHFPSPGQSSFIGFSYVASYFSTLQFLHNRVISGKLKKHYFHAASVIEVLKIFLHLIVILVI